MPPHVTGVTYLWYAKASWMGPEGGFGKIKLIITNFKQLLIMKKLEKINFSQCDTLSNDQLNNVRGGMDTSTYQSVCNCDTDCCGEDIGYVITWDCGGKSTGIICECVDEE